jgi:hypothetical protein
MLEHIRSIAELRPLVEQAQECLSFWGERYITLPNQKERLPIDSLAARVIELVKLTPHFDEMEREQGKQIAKKINHIYDRNDLRVKESRWITYLFAIFRNFPVSITRLNWEGQQSIFGCFEGYKQVFNLYTKEQYLNNFTGLFSFDYSETACCFDFPDRIKRYQDPDFEKIPPGEIRNPNHLSLQPRSDGGLNYSNGWYNPGWRPKKT